MFFHFGRAFCATTIVCVMALAPVGAKADSRSSQPSKPTSTETLRLASGGLNLLSAPKTRSSSAGRKRVAVGNGSYICSPAGFGQPSRCYSN